MIIGVPREIKDNEARVGVTPAGVKALAEAGHVGGIGTAAGAGRLEVERDLARDHVAVALEATVAVRVRFVPSTAPEPWTARVVFSRSERRPRVDKLRDVERARRVARS